MNTQEIVITRQFDASPELIFEAWMSPAKLARWWGPKGFTSPVCNLDVRPGGRIHVVMRGPNGIDYPMGGEFRQIQPPERLVFTTGALDQSGKLMFEFLHTLTLVRADRKTALTLRSRIIRTTPGAEKFTNGFEAGMTQSLQRLADFATSESDASDREIVTTRVLNAPREMVFDAWTDPEQIVKWWGPAGFSTTIQKMDVRPGGEWKQVMHGPDGTDYPNTHVFTEVTRPERIAYTHGGRREGGPEVRSQMTVTFEDLGDQTRLTMRMVFPSAEARDHTVREYNAVEGAKQTVGRLAEFLSKKEIDQPAFVITREFHAPRELVWKAWTEFNRLAVWWGPRGFEMLHCKIDLWPGGMFHYAMRAPNGFEMWGKFVYRQVIAPERLVFVNSFSDKDGGTTRHFASPTWPLEVLNVLTLTEHNGRTTLALKGTPINATAQERKTFADGFESMQKGFGGTLDQLDEYVAKM